MKTYFKISLFILLVYPKIIYSQDTIKLKNSTYLELLGSGFYYSFNYDRVLLSNSKSSINLRLGINWHPFTPIWTGGSNIILGLNWKNYINNTIFIFFGLNSIYWITYSPIPRNKEQRAIAYNDPENWGQPFNPSFQFSLNGSLGFGKNLKGNNFLSASVSPHYFIQYGIYKESFIRVWGAISIGKYF